MKSMKHGVYYVDKKKKDDLILEGETRVGARQKWVSRFGKKWVMMKMHWILHPDEEDPAVICLLLSAMNLNRLNVWGGEESYSFSLEQEEEESGGKGRAKRARKGRLREPGEEGKEEEGASLVIHFCFPLLFCAAGGRDGRRRRRRERCNRYVPFFPSSATGVVVLAGPPSPLPQWDLVGVWPNW